MKVLFVSHGYPPAGVAGVERLSAQTAEELVARGHSVTVLTRRPSEVPATLALRRAVRSGVLVVSAIGGGVEYDEFPLHEPSLERIFERMLVEVMPDVVLISHLMHHSPGYVAVAHRWGIPVVLELHDFFMLCPRAHLQRRSGELCEGPEGGAACATHCFSEQRDAKARWALRSQSFREVLRWADEIVAPSQFLAAAFAPMREGGSPIRVIDNPVADLGPVLRDKPDPGAPIRLASIGVTVEHKGFHVVIEALRRARLPASVYTIFGLAIPPQSRELLEAADEVAGLELRLFGAFSPSQLPSLLADIDALVVPSIVAETYSIVTREAFACGLPVIASEIGALPDAIRPGENGWLFDPDDATDLAGLLQELSGDRGQLRRAAAGIRPSDTSSVATRTTRLEGLLGATAREKAMVRLHSEELRLMREALAAADARSGSTAA